MRMPLHPRQVSEVVEEIAADETETVVEEAAEIVGEEIGTVVETAEAETEVLIETVETETEEASVDLAERPKWPPPHRKRSLSENRPANLKAPSP